MEKGSRFLYMMITPDMNILESKAFQDAIEKFESDNDCFFSGCTGEILIFQGNKHHPMWSASTNKILKAI